MDWNQLISRLINYNDAKAFLKESQAYHDVINDGDSEPQEYEQAAADYKLAIIRFAGSFFVKLCEWRIKANG